MAKCQGILLRQGIASGDHGPALIVQPVRVFLPQFGHRQCLVPHFGVEAVVLFDALDDFRLEAEDCMEKVDPGASFVFDSDLGGPGPRSSRTLTVRSELPETSRRPSGLNARHVTRPVCSLKVSVSWPLSASQTITRRSPPADASRFPSGLNTTLETQVVCPAKVNTFWPLSVSHVLTVLSPLADASRVPSGLNTTLWTQSV